MKRTRGYRFEFGLIAAAVLVSILGFWDIYVGPRADPQPHHHLHIVTAFVWMGLLAAQLRLLARNDYAAHRKLGLVVLLVAPLLVATTAMLSVHSAHKGVVSGEGDFLIVQNVMGTIELAALIVLAFVLKSRSAVHGALLLGTTILFIGIALFFALISFAPPFRIEGPETFYRFQTAAMTSQFVCLALGLVFFLRDRRNGWPFLAAGASLLLNEAIRAALTSLDLIDPLTAAVGSLSQPFTFVLTFALLSAMLAALTLPTRRKARPA
jgi:hypothetical protein